MFLGLFGSYFDERLTPNVIWMTGVMYPTQLTPVGYELRLIIH